MQNTQAIDTFLESWRKASFNYYQDLANEQNKLFDKKNEIMDKYGYHYTRPGQEFAPEWEDVKQKIKEFESKQTKNDLNIIGNMRYDLLQHRGDKFLNEILDREVKAKKVHFISRIEKKSGEIKEVNLNIGVDGSINGTVVGNNATVDVYSIVAGGYNIQRAHYRVLVKEK